LGLEGFDAGFDADFCDFAVDAGCALPVGAGAAAGAPELGGGAGCDGGFADVSAAAGFAVASAGGGGGGWAREAPGETTETDASTAEKAATRRSFATIWITRDSFRLDAGPVSTSGCPAARAQSAALGRVANRAFGNAVSPRAVAQTGWATYQSGEWRRNARHRRPRCVRP